MIPQATLEKMYSMRLHGMANAFRTTMEPGFAHNFTTDELIAHLVDSEWEERFNRRLSVSIRRSTCCPNGEPVLTFGAKTHAK